MKDNRGTGKNFPACVFPSFFVVTGGLGILKLNRQIGSLLLRPKALCISIVCGGGQLCGLLARFGAGWPDSSASSFPLGSP